MESDAYSAELFNLRLYVQRLEEELIYYRNGATTAELWELIHEKDVEVETWRAKFDSSEEKLKRLMKASDNVFVQIEQKAEHNSALERELLSLQDQLQEQSRHMSLVERSSSELQTTIDSLRMELQSRDDTIGTLRLQVWESSQKTNEIASQRDNRLRELQSATEASQLASQSLEQKIESLTSELAATQKSLSESNMKLENAQKEVARWKVNVDDQDAYIAKLHARCAGLVTELQQKMSKLDKEHMDLIKQVQGYQEHLLGQINERSAALVKKDEKIKDLMIQNKTLQHEMRRLKSKSASSRPHEENAESRPLDLFSKAAASGKDKEGWGTSKHGVPPLGDNTNSSRTRAARSAPTAAI